MIKHRFAIILLLCAICLVGCKTKGNPGTNEPTPAPPEQGSPSPGQSDTDPDGSSQFTFEDGLISLEIKDGRVGISFDHDLWDKRYNLYESIDPESYPPEMLQPGPFPVSGLPGAVKDACIGMIAAFDRYAYDNFITPAVVLLMEDGSISMTFADPYTQGKDTVFQCLQLPWLKDIVSLAYENDSAGEKTIYATDKGGLRYDLRIAFGCSALINEELYCVESGYGGSAGNAGNYLALTLLDNGVAVFEKFWGESNERYEIYNGTYELQLAENPAEGQPRAGAVTFALNLDWWIWEQSGEMTERELDFWNEGWELNGVYYLEIGLNRGEITLDLKYIEGKGLVIYADRRSPDALFAFSNVRVAPDYGE